MNVTRRDLRPGETIFGGGAGAFFLGRDSINSQSEPKSAEEVLMQLVREQMLKESRTEQRRTSEECNQLQHINKDILMSDMTTITQTDSFIHS